jgi:hypothetical protein
VPHVVDTFVVVNVSQVMMFLLIAFVVLLMQAMMPLVFVEIVAS